MYLPTPVRGLGITSGQASAVAGGAVSIASTAMNPNLPLSTQIESSIASGLLSAAPFAGPAAPFLVVAGGVASLLAAFGVGSGCGETCVLSTKYANQAESLLKQNLDTYLAQHPRYYSAQQAALGVFNAVWNDLVQQCSNPSLGSAGQRCISDRQAGACKWRDSSGRCFNWFSGYRDPIANDPTVQPDDPTPANPVTSALDSVVGSGWTSDLLPLAVIGGLVALAAMA
jgi:hypothetical protein